MLNQTWLKRLIVFLLAGATATVLLLNIPAYDSARFYAGYVVTYILLTALALPLGVLILQGEISLVHVVGIIAFLSLEQQALPSTLWALFIGSMVGGIALMVRSRSYLPGRRSVPRNLRSITVTGARVTLSYFAAAQLYIRLGGELSLGVGSNEVIPPVLAYCAFYVSVYAAIYALELYIEEQDVLYIIQHNWSQIAIILVMPVAYAVLVAIIHTELPGELFVLSLLGLVLIITVTFSYSRNQYLMRQQLDEVNALSSLGQRLQVTESPEEVLSSVKNQLLKILDTENLIITLGGDGNKNPAQALLSIHRGTQRSDLDPADAQLVDKIIAGGFPILIENDVASYLQMFNIVLHREHVNSWLGMPMVVRGEVIGAIAVYALDKREFNAADMRRMRIVASTLGSALDNARMYQQQQQRVSRLNTLNTISNLLSSTLSRDSVLNTITTSAAMLTEANAVAVYLSEEGKPVLQRSAGLSDRFIENPPGLLLQAAPIGITDANTLPEYQPTIIRDAQTDRATHASANIYRKEEIHTLVELPLAAGENMTGAVVLYYDQVRTFSTETIEFMRAFAGEAVQAIQNADLYTRTDAALEARLIQLSILAAVGQQTNASIEHKTISDVILTFATDYSRTPYGILTLLDPLTETHRVSAHMGYEAQAIDEKHVIESVVKKALQTERFELLHNGDARVTSRKITPEAKAQLTVPILRDRQPLGALILERTDDETFDNDTTSFLIQLMNQAAIAIDNRNLFQTVMRSRDRMKVILDAMTEAVILLDASGYIVLANPAVQLIGLEHEAILHRDVADLITDEASNLGFASSAEIKTLIQKLQAGDKTMPHSYKFIEGQSTKLIERHSVPVRAADQKLIGVLLVFYDQTKQMELDNTRDEFTRMIVHDLRSPLTAIKTSMHLISHLVPEDVTGREKIETVLQTSQGAVRKMLQRITSLLDVARMEGGEIKLEKTSFTIQEPIQAVFAELNALAQDENVRLVQKLAQQDLPPIYADSDKIERVFLNLVDNALKYTEKDTDVIVRASLSKEMGDFLRVDVIDQGPGIPADYRERLFDRFVQVEGRDVVRSGVGLGLTFCRLVIEAHGGKIWIEDNPAGGAVFAFTLPIVTVTELESHELPGIPG